MSCELWALESAYVSSTDQRVLGSGSDLWVRRVEEALSQHAAVRNCVVLEMTEWKMTDLAHGKELFAFVTLRAELTGREQELRNWLRDKIDADKTVERIVILSELPKGPPGDLDRSALKELALSLETGIEVVS
jgi:acyl-coenzyme A synthetase/AMP-(fatty) acid ligase